jgi:hypothetical protein
MAGRKTQLFESKPGQWLVRLAAAFYMLVVPVMAARGAYNAARLLFLCIGAFLFAQLWFNVVFSAYTSACVLYGVRIRHPSFVYQYPLPLLAKAATPQAEIVRAVGRAAFSYVLSVYAFGVIYLYLSHESPRAFNVGRLDIVGSFYFSAVTATTVGYGDITATSSAARLCVIGQLAFNLLYVLFLFSVFSGAIKSTLNRREDAAEE